jgi:site-specific DNA-methyltransferase (adenine-specific)
MTVARTARRQPSQLGIAYDCRQQMSAMNLMRWLQPCVAAMVVLDPQYRGVLDKMQYGNEGKQRETSRAKLPTMSEYQIALLIEQAERVLKPGSHLLLWVDKFMLAEARHLALFAYAADLKRVELFHWNKLRPGMGQRGRCRSEYLVIAQKPPISAKVWRADRRIDDSWPEASDRSLHPHAKPHQLLTRLVRLLTKQGELVVDPCAGSYSTLEVCKLTRRKFLGCDLVTPL